MIDHFDAMKSRLQEHPSLANKVYDTARLDTHGAFIRDNYVILFGGSPAELGGDRLHRSQVLDDNAVFDYTVRAVGTTADVVRDLLRAVALQFVAWTPTIVGRSCRPVRYSGGSEVRMENSVKPPLMYADEEYELRSFFRSGS